MPIQLATHGSPASSAVRYVALDAPSLFDEVVASAARFVKITLVAAAALVGLWLFSGLLASGSAAAVVTPMVASTHAQASTGVTLLAATSGGKKVAKRGKSKPRHVAKYAGGVTCRGNCDGDRVRGSLYVRCKGKCDIRVGKRTHIVSQGKQGRAGISLYRSAGKRVSTSAYCGGSKCGVDVKAGNGKLDKGRTARKKGTDGIVRITRWHKNVGESFDGHRKGDVELELGGVGILRDAKGRTARATDPRGFASDSAVIFRHRGRKADQPLSGARVNGLGVVSAAKGNTARSTDDFHGSAAITFYRGGVQRSQVHQAGNFNMPGVGRADIKPMKDGACCSSAELYSGGAGKPPRGEVVGKGSLTVGDKSVRVDSQFLGDSKTLKGRR